MSSPTKPTKYQEILQQEVTRKQFLQVLTLGVVSILGFSNLLGMLQRLNKPAKNDSQADASKGFGGGKFGV